MAVGDPSNISASQFLEFLTFNDLYFHLLSVTYYAPFPPHQWHHLYKCEFHHVPLDPWSLIFPILSSGYFLDISSSLPSPSCPAYIPQSVFYTLHPLCPNTFQWHLPEQQQTQRDATGCLFHTFPLSLFKNPHKLCRWCLLYSSSVSI